MENQNLLKRIDKHMEKVMLHFGYAKEALTLAKENKGTQMIVGSIGVENGPLTKDAQEKCLIECVREMGAREKQVREWNEIKSIVSNAPEIFKALKLAIKNANALAVRLVQADEHLLKDHGAIKECEMGEITRWEMDLSEITKVISKAEGR